MRYISEKELITTTINNVDNCDECLQRVISQNENICFESIDYSGAERKLCIKTKEPLNIDKQKVYRIVPKQFK